MELFSRKLGTGYPLIILHGLYGSSDNWLSIAKQFADYFDVYLLDARNHGQSPHNPIHNYDVMVEDLHEFMNSNNLQKSIILGHSMGGKTAMLFANKYPAKVSQLIIADIAPKTYPLDGINAATHRKIMNILKNIDISKFNNYSDAEQALQQDLDDEKLRKFLLKNLKRNQNNVFEWRLNVDALYNNIEQVTDGFSNQIWKTYSSPTLFLKGELSDYILKSDFDDIKLKYPNSKIVTIPKAGHWLHAEQPLVFVKEIMKFIL